jgi:hypothetical protein
MSNLRDHLRHRTLTCGTHGKTEWHGTICCAKCKAPYQTEDGTAPHYAPEICSCGVRLMPESKLSKRFSARAICDECFVDMTKNEA